MARVRRLLAASLGGALLVCSGWARPAQAAGTPRREPEPSWVKPLDLTLEPVHDDPSGRDTVKLLRDTRIRLDARGVDRYFHYAAQALNATGVEHLAELLVEFDPSYQSLILHRIGVWRSGQLLDQSRSAAVRMVASEDELERRVYNGSVSAYVVLSDVRAGDIVDVSYTLRGENPALGGRYASEVALGDEDPVRRRHVEVEHDPTRPELHFKVRGIAAEAEHPSPERWVWDLRDVPAHADEDAVPVSTPEPSIQLSEFADWQDVAHWGAALYPLVPTPALGKQARELTASLDDPEKIALTLLRFVQDDVRYLAIATGENSLKPHPPGSALRERLGDCKDKTYLLMHLLHERGIAARPVLVNSEEDAHVQDYLPSPFAFDHVILRVELGERHFYVDATHALQGGNWSTQSPPEFGLGLRLVDDSAGLETIPRPEPAGPDHDVTTEVRVNADESASIDVTTALQADAADDMRGQLADSSQKELAEQYANYYQHEFPELTIVTPLEVHDERLDNKLRLLEHYRAAHFWRKTERTLYAESIDKLLDAPHVVRRTLPLAVEYPLWHRETFNVTLPFDRSVEPSSVTIDDAAIKYSRVVTLSGRRVSALFEYRSLSDIVPLAAVTEHLKTLERARDEQGLYLSNGPDESLEAEAPTPGRGDGSGWMLGVLAALLLLPSIAGIRWASRRRGFKKRRDGQLGDTPARASRVRSRDVAASEMAKARCACGAALGGTPVDFSDLRFEGGVVSVGRSDCSACGGAVRRYFSISN